MCTKCSASDSVRGSGRPPAVASARAKTASRGTKFNPSTFEYSLHEYSLDEKSNEPAPWIASGGANLTKPAEHEWGRIALRRDGLFQHRDLCIENVNPYREPGLTKHMHWTGVVAVRACRTYP